MNLYSKLPPDEQALHAQMDAIRQQLAEKRSLRAAVNAEIMVGKFYRRATLGRYSGTSEPDSWSVWTRVDFRHEDSLWGVEIKESSPGELYNVDLHESLGAGEGIGEEITRAEWDAKVAEVLARMRDGLPPFAAPSTQAGNEGR